jgi:phage FluMu protein Com
MRNLLCKLIHGRVRVYGDETYTDKFLEHKLSEFNFYCTYVKKKCPICKKFYILRVWTKYAQQIRKAFGY